MRRYRMKETYSENKASVAIHNTIEEYLVANTPSLKKVKYKIESFTAQYNEVYKNDKAAQDAKYHAIDASRIKASEEIHEYIQSKGYYVNEVRVKYNYSAVEISVERYVSMEFNFGKDRLYLMDNDTTPYNESLRVRIDNDEADIMATTRHIATISAISAMAPVISNIISKNYKKAEETKEEFKNLNKDVIVEDKMILRHKIEAEARTYAVLLQEAMMNELDKNGLKNLDISGYYLISKDAKYSTSKMVNNFKKLQMTKSKLTFMDKEHNHVFINVSLKNIGQYAVIISQQDSHNEIVFMEDSTITRIMMKLNNF